MLSQSGAAGLCTHDKLYEVHLQLRAAEFPGYVRHQASVDLGQVRQTDRRPISMSLRAVFFITMQCTDPR